VASQKGLGLATFFRDLEWSNRYCGQSVKKHGAWGRAKERESPCRDYPVSISHFSRSFKWSTMPKTGPSTAPQEEGARVNPFANHLVYQA